MKRKEIRLLIVMFIFIGFFIISAIRVNAQVPVDSLIVQLERLVEKEPKNYEAYFNLGVAYLNKNMIEKSIESYKKAISIKPDFAEAHNNLGILYYSQGKLDEAITELESAVKYNSNLAEAFNYLGMAYLGKGDVDEAISNHKSAIRINPEAYSYYGNLGYDYYKKGDFNNAVNYYKLIKNSLENDNLCSEYIFLKCLLKLAECYKEMGNVTETEKICNEILSSNLNQDKRVKNIINYVKSLISNR